MSLFRTKLACAFAGVLATPLIAAAAPVTYSGAFHPSNGSGVSGTTLLTLDGNTLTVVINATGLEPNQPHPQHIHGFADDRESVCPPEQLTPAIDLNNNGILDPVEGEALIGPPILPLTLDDNDGINGDDDETFPTAPDGTINYSRTFENVDLSLLGPLDRRAVELHGLTIDGTYNPLLPIACAELALDDDGGTVIPLPAGVWPGLALLGMIATRARMRGRAKV